MHLIIAVEGYREAIERWVKEVEALDMSLKSSDTGWRPAVREVKLFDVVVPEERLDDFLKEIGDGSAQMGMKGQKDQPEAAISAERMGGIKSLFAQMLGLDQVPQKGYGEKIKRAGLYLVILGSLPQAVGGKQMHEFL